MKDQEKPAHFAILLGKLKQDSLLDKLFDKFCQKMFDAYEANPANLLCMLAGVILFGFGFGFVVTEYLFPLIKARMS